jgi:hypothetical protein
MTCARLALRAGPFDFFRFAQSLRAGSTAVRKGLFFAYPALALALPLAGSLRDRAGLFSVVPLKRDWRCEKESGIGAATRL